MMKRDNNDSSGIKWFVNNQVVIGLLTLLLVLLNILVFTKVSYLFEPIAQFFAIIGIPLVTAGIFYYFLNPLVDYLENKYSVPRVWTITALFILIVALIAWGTISFIPKIKGQALSLISNWPTYWDNVNQAIDDLLKNPNFRSFKDQLDTISSDLFSSLKETLTSLTKNTFSGLGNVVGAVASIVVTIVTFPFILFYLLKDGKKLPGLLMKFIPTKQRKPLMQVLTEINEQVSSYVRGQLGVAFIVAIMFMIGFGIIGLDYAVLLGVLAGILNLIPYLGSALAMIPVLIVALATSPAMIIKAIIIFVIEQLIEGKLVSPLVLGSQMSMHPVTIIFVLLTTGKLFGVVGVMLGIPGYAALKVVVTHIFQWYQKKSNLYPEEVKEEPDS